MIFVSVQLEKKGSEVLYRVFQNEGAVNSQMISWYKVSMDFRSLTVSEKRGVGINENWF